MKKYLQILKKCLLFRDIEPQDLEGMLTCLNAKIITAKKGQPVFWEGEPAKYVGIILSGAVQIEMNDFYGNRSLVGMVQPAQVFGEVFACAGTEMLPISVISYCDSEIMLIDCKRILITCGNACLFHNRLIENLLYIVATKNLILNQKIQILSKRTTKEKIMSYLLWEAKHAQSSSFTIPYNRQELADYLGVERSAMSAEIGKLRAQGLIECKKSDFKLLKTED